MSTEYIPTVIKKRRLFIRPNSANRDSYIYRTYGERCYDCTVEIHYKFEYGQVDVKNNHTNNVTIGLGIFHSYNSPSIDTFLNDWEVLSRRVLIEKTACI
jgi:hypothetical protein